MEWEFPNQKYSVWIEAEHWEPGEWVVDDCNTDVRVDFEDGRSWVATCFTYKNILSLVERNKETGECLHGKYFWATHMFLVDEVSRRRLEQVIDHLVQTGDFEQVFTNMKRAT